MVFQRESRAQIAQAREEMNYLMGLAEMMTGVPGVMPRYPEERPAPIIQAAPVTLNNIRIDRSTIGAVNLGQIQNLDVMIGSVRDTGNSELAEKLAEFAAAVVKEASFAAEQRSEILEQLEVVSVAAAQPKLVKKGAVKANLLAIGQAVQSVAALVQLWGSIAPAVTQLLAS